MFRSYPAPHAIRAQVDPPKCFCGKPVASRALGMCEKHAEIVMSDVGDLGRGTYQEDDRC